MIALLHNRYVALLFLMVSIVAAGCYEEESLFGGSKTFLKLYGTPGEDIGKEVLQSADGGFILIGTANTVFTGIGNQAGGSIFVVKTDIAGNEIWSKNYLDSVSVGNSIQPTTDGGYMLLGTQFFNEDETPHSDMALIKIAANGETIWSKNFSFANQPFSIEIGNKLRATRDGGFILIGTTLAVPANNNGLNMYVVKIDADGNRQWERSYGFDENQNDFGTAVLEAPNGDFIWMGYAEVNRAGQTDMRAVRSNSIGNLIWDFRYGEANNDLGIDVQNIADGFILAGAVRLGNQRAYLVKIDNNGQIVWERNYTIGTNTIANSVQLTLDGGFALTGRTSFQGIDSDIFLIRTDNNGEELWTQRYGGSGQDEGNCILQMPDGGFLICGTIQFENTRMICLIKTDANGLISEVE